MIHDMGLVLKLRNNSCIMAVHCKRERYLVLFACCIVEHRSDAIYGTSRL